MTWQSQPTDTSVKRVDSGLTGLGDSSLISISPRAPEQVPIPETPSRTSSLADRDTLLSTVLKRATDDHKILWRVVGRGVYTTYAPPKFDRQFQVVNGAEAEYATDSADELWFCVDEAERFQLEPLWPELHDLVISVEAQVGKVNKAIAEIMEALEDL